MDGTILENGERAGLLYDDAIRDVSGFAPTGVRPGEHGKTDAQIISERLAQYGLDPLLLPAVSARLDELSEAGNAGAHARRVAPGVQQALAAVAQAGWVNGLLTGNSPARVRFKFAGAGLPADLFAWDRSYFGDRALVRSDITRAAAAALAGSTAVILGDTPSDGAAAAAVGFPFIAVATGVFDEPALRATSAIAVVPDLVEGLPAVLAALATL